MLALKPSNRIITTMSSLTKAFINLRQLNFDNELSSKLSFSTNHLRTFVLILQKNINYKYSP